MTQQENQKTTIKDIQYFYEKNRFSTLFRDTKKYRDFWRSKSALFCMGLSIIITGLLLFIISQSSGQIGNLLDIIRAILLTITGGFFGLLGLIIGGLALITASIGENVITKVRKKEKIEELISVIFNFYFSGAITGLTLIISLITYIVTFIPLPFNIMLFIFWSLLLSYFVIFSIVYSIMLLGTCIRIFLLRYYYLTNI